LQGNATGTSQTSVPGGPPAAAGVRFPGEDGGSSLAEMAQRDLDAALQLLADRAQYITGSSGAAIALRRDGKKDMLCRASSGSNAPDLGALLSTEFGLSGESVRTRQLLRCDDAERDGRVNREACRELGIASVVVMPVVNDDEVLGVFELFSGKANAFGERDFTALRRLSEMVETAVRLAQATKDISKHLQAEQNLDLARLETPQPRMPWPETEVEIETPGLTEPDVPETSSLSPCSQKSTEKAAGPEKAEEAVLPPPKVGQSVGDLRAPSAKAIGTEPPSGAIRPLLWSIALDAHGEPVVANNDQSHVPTTLRNLKKCEACGFPVSPGRALCVECEEKKWRGQLHLPKRAEPTERAAPASLASSRVSSVPPIPAMDRAIPGEKPATKAVLSASGFGAAAAPAPALEVAKPIPAVTSDLGIQPAAALEVTAAPGQSSAAGRETPGEASPAPVASPELVLSAALEPSQTWLARNKLILLPLAVIAAAAVFLLLR